MLPTTDLFRIAFTIVTKNYHHLNSKISITYQEPDAVNTEEYP